MVIRLCEKKGQESQSTIINRCVIYRDFLPLIKHRSTYIHDGGLEAFKLFAALDKYNIVCYICPL